MDVGDGGQAKEGAAMSWIKVECSTPNKPEVLKLARLLNVSRDDAFGKAMRFWIWLDGVTVDGVVDGVTSHDVDAVVGAVGVADALVLAGWLTISEDGQTIAVPNFDRHNGESAKARGLKTKRQAKWRAGRVDGEASTSASTREEKSRVLTKKEKKATTDLIGGTCLDTPEFREAWNVCKSHLAENSDKGKLSEAWEQSALAGLARLGYARALADVRCTCQVANARNICDSTQPKPRAAKAARPPDPSTTRTLTPA
jgi:hypothetical protein